MSEFIYDNKKVYYEVHGEGEPLLFLNGIMMSQLSWKLFLPHLGTNRQVILLDFLDQGFSDKCEGESYKHDLQVEVVYHLLQHLGIEKVNVVGISYGAQIALQVAIKYGSYVNRLMIFNANSYTSPQLQDIGRGWIDAAKTHDPMTYYNVSIPYIYSPAFYNNNYEWMAKRKALLSSVFTPDFLDAMVRLIESSEGYDVRQELHKITAKTLVVASELDDITPCYETESIYEGIPEAEFVLLVGCGHVSIYERPNEFVTLVNGFMQKTKRVKII